MATFTGTLSGNDSIAGGAASDIIYGYGGNDTLGGSTGEDTLNGAGGDDTYIINSAGDSIAGETASTGTQDTIVDDYGRGNVALTNFIENLTLRNTALVGGWSYGIGNALANTIRGNDQANILDGGDLNDTIYGGGGSDSIHGGKSTTAASDNDQLFGEAGNDTLEGGVGNDSLNGGVDNDSLVGGAGIDTLDGGSGNDTLVGGAGTDSLIGGEGNDVYVIADATDTSDVINEAGTTLGDEVQSAVTYSIAALSTVENLTLTGIGNTNATGNGAKNTLRGNDGANTLDGGADDDALYGGKGSDILKGGEGNDTLDGGLANDNMDGQNGSDVYIAGDAISGHDFDTIVDTGTTGIDEVKFYGAGYYASIGSGIENITLLGDRSASAGGNELANKLVGNALDNLLEGGANNDTLAGGLGNDTLKGDAGIDSMDGGAGNDTYYVDNAGDVITDAPEVGSKDSEIVSISGLTLAANIENMGVAVVSTTSQLTLEASGKIWLTGNGGDNVITGSNLVGNLLNGGVGNDTLIGGDLNDELNGDAGVNRLEGGKGDDIYFVNDANQTVIEGPDGGNDTLVLLSAANITLADNVERQQIVGYYATTVPSAVLGFLGDFNVTGNLLGNQLNGSNGVNVLNGMAGNDTIYAFGGDDTVYGGEGADSVSGGTGNDLIDGGAGNDTLLGSNGDDTLNGGTGIDQLNGGVGADTYYVDELNDSITELTEAGVVDTVVVGITGYTLALGIEVMKGSNAANLLGEGFLTLKGNAEANRIEGALGVDNSILAGVGDDTLFGGDLNDDIYGEADNDYLDAGNGNDTLFGGAGQDTILGGAGNDTIQGQDGNDDLDGGTGIDTVSGGLGDDIYYVDDAADVVTELAGQGDADIVYSSATSYTLTDNVETLVLFGEGNLTGYGNGQANALYGNDYNNFLSGGAGNDLLLGQDGNDTLLGDAGDDILIGGSGNDKYGFFADVAFGHDWVDNSADVDGVDTIALQGITADKVWLQFAGNDLVISVLGTNNQITVSGWTDPGHRVDALRTGAYIGTAYQQLDQSKVASLVQAMSGISATVPASLTQAQIATVQSYWTSFAA